MGIKKIPKSVKICCIVTAILILIILTVILVLYFTILKPKQPKVTAQEVTLKNFNLLLNPFHLTVTLGLVVNVNNPNYASFKYDNSTAYVTYHNTPAADAPIEADTIPARGQHDVSTEVLVDVDNLVSSPYFFADFASGYLNFTSSTTLHGKAKVLNLFKIKATTYSTCNITLYVVVRNASSVCTSKVEY